MRRDQDVVAVMTHDQEAYAPEAGSLDGTTDVLLAPIRGRDLRRNAPGELFVRSPRRFVAKLGFSLAVVAAGAAAVLAGVSWVAVVPILVLLGLCFAHMVELQHECLHEHAFNSRRLNRIAGVVCGVLMLSSYSHYKYMHLRHHAYLGTPRNNEFFNYRFQRLNSWPGFLYAAFHLGRYREVAANIGRSVLRRAIPGVTSSVEARKIRQEYVLFLGFTGLVVAVTALTGNLWVLAVWVLPLLVVSEATHFMIELPEHYGLNTQTDSNVLTNTRTIRASRFAQWFTNFNNLHTAHHYHQGVPMANVERLDAMAHQQFEVVDGSYPSFYLGVIRGEITQDLSETCMTR
jgi:fatty acid desaturase